MRLIFTLKKKKIDLGFELTGLKNVILVIIYKLQNFCEKKSCPKRELVGKAVSCSGKEASLTFPSSGF